VREEDDLPVRELLKILPLPAPGYICVRTPDRPGSVRCVLFLGGYVRYGTAVRLGLCFGQGAVGDRGGSATPPGAGRIL
jgi:hypothetical protein